MGLWRNSDGLYVKIGTTEAEVVRGGELKSFGSYQEIEQVIDLTGLGSSSALLSDSYPGVVIPKDFFFEEIEVTNEVASTGTNATLNLGLVRITDASTEIDVDGLLVAAPRTDWDTAGETKTYRVGVTGVGALIGTATSYAGYLVADYDTAAFTAGRIRVTIRGYVRRPAASN